VPDRREIVARAFGEGSSSCAVVGEGEDEGGCDDGDLLVSDGRRARVRKLGLMMLARGERRPRMEVSILVAWILSHDVS
jgi:hypothetical protein